MPGTLAHDSLAASLSGGFANPLTATTTSTIVQTAARSNLVRVRLTTGVATVAAGTLDVEIQGSDDPAFNLNNAPTVSYGKFPQINGPLNTTGVAISSWTNASPAVFTSAAHGLAVGNYVTLSGMSIAALNGLYIVNTVPLATTFTLATTGVGGGIVNTPGATGTGTVTPVSGQSNQTKYLVADVQKLYMRAIATVGGSGSTASVVIDVDMVRYERTGTDTA